MAAVSHGALKPAACMNLRHVALLYTQRMNSLFYVEHKTQQTALFDQIIVLRLKYEIYIQIQKIFFQLKFEKPF